VKHPAEPFLSCRGLVLNALPLTYCPHKCHTAFMRNIFLVCLLAWAVFPTTIAYAQTVPDVNYVAVDRTQSGITVSLMQDFIRMVRDYKIKDILVSPTHFSFQRDSMVYVIPSEGYKTLKDYQDGHGKNFKDAASFYYAQDNKLKTQEEVEQHKAAEQQEKAKQAQMKFYWDSEYFISETDYANAQKAGFVRNAAQGKRLNRIYGLLSGEEMQKNAQYLNLVLYADNSNGRYVNRQAVSDMSSALPNPMQVYRKRITKLNSGYYILDIELQGSDSDAVFYYTCKICGYDTLNEYLAFFDAQDIKKNANDRFTIRRTEEKAVDDLHFSCLKEMLEADKSNVRNGNDWTLIKRYGLSNESLEKNRQFINELDAYYTEFLAGKQLEYSALQCVYTLWFLKNYQKKPAYFDYVARRILRQNQASSLRSFNPDSFLASFEEIIRSLLKNHPKTAQIISFDEETGLLCGK